MTTKSTFAKAQADEIALAASAGLITVRQGSSFGRVWRITPQGLHILWGALPTMETQLIEEVITDEP